MRRSMKLLLWRLAGLAVLIGAFAEAPEWTPGPAQPAVAPTHAMNSVPAARS